jgi:hypothetical protein
LTSSLLILANFSKVLMTNGESALSLRGVIG